MNLWVDKQRLADTLGNSRRLLRALENRMRSGQKGIFRREGGKFAKQLFNHTLPNNLDGKAGGEGRVIRDTRKIFKPVRSMPFAAYVHAKNWQGVAGYDFRFKNPKFNEYLDNQDYERLPYVLHKTMASEYMAQANAANDFIDEPTREMHKQGRQPLLPYTGRTTKTFYVKGKKARGVINTYANLARYAVGKMSGGWRTAAGQLGESLAGMTFVGKGIGWGAVWRESNATVLEVGNAYANFNYYADRSGDYRNDFKTLQDNILTETTILLAKTIVELEID